MCEGVVVGGEGEKGGGSCSMRCADLWYFSLLGRL